MRDAPPSARRPTPHATRARAAGLLVDLLIAAVAAVGLRAARGTGGAAPVRADRRRPADTQALRQVGGARTPSGPRSRPQQRRALAWVAAWSGATTAGAVLARLRGRPARQAFLHGLSLPGGGYAVSRSPGRGLLAAITWIGSYYAWPTLGNLLAPIAALLGTARMSARRARRTGATASTASLLTVPAVSAAAAAGLAAGRRAAHRRHVATGQRRTERLAVLDPAPSVPSEEVGEWSREELAHLRRILDVALQPLDSFDGFLTIDQVRDAAWRYQLSFPTWAMGLTGNNRTPAMTSYLATAQERLIRKHTDKRVWRYWATENLWGHLRWDPEPLHSENIMFSGYLLLALGAMREQTGDPTFEQPASLRFEWSSGRSWDYDTHRVAEVVMDNYRRVRNGLAAYPCEPHWVYSICNIFTASGLMLHDRLHGTDHVGEIGEALREALLHDFTGTDGASMTMRCSLTGFAPPLLERASTQDAISSFFLAPFMPELAARTYAIVRDELVGFDADGCLQVPLGFFDRIDPGDYRPRPTFTYAVLGLAASEHGDTEVVAAARRTFERDFPAEHHDGAARYRASPSTNTWLTMMAGNRPGGWARFVTRGEDHDGARLAECAYPEVLVARAVSTADTLDLVLHDGRGPGPQRLGIDQLVPGRTYELRRTHDGQSGPLAKIQADAEGRADVTVDLDGRTEVRLAPATA